MRASITDRGLFGYAGKRVVVSGCSSGIGAATAGLLLDLGAEVHGIDVTTPGVALDSFSQLDLRESRNVGAVVEGIGGPVDALFNCAGVPPGRPPLDVVKVNFIGTRLLTEVVLPLMPTGGAVVSVGSNGGMGWTSRLPTLLEFVGTPSYDVAAAWCEANAETVAEGYRFSKEAVLVWTLRSSVQSIKSGIRMNCTAPGAVQTPMLAEIEQTTPTAVIDAIAQPIGRRSTPEEQAFPLVALNSSAASYVNGVALPVDGGFAAKVLSSPL
jgi:NAD(P)-dependent dehydrogenase (short-subunit alcohol dehydrogenase family)